MRQEATSKFSEVILITVVMVSFTSLVVIGFGLILGTHGNPQSLRSLLTLWVSGIVVAAFGLRALSTSGFKLSEEGISVGRPFGEHLIAFSSISRVERVRRKGSKNGERVRVIFAEEGEEKTVEITPANPALLVHDVLRNCPQITQTKSSTLKKDGSFRAAKKSMARPRHCMAPVDY